MWLLHCLLIIIHWKEECYLPPFLVTVISTYTSLWKSTEKSLSYTVYTSHSGVRCSCYMWKITIILIKTSKCKNSYTICDFQAGHLWYTLSLGAVLPYYRTPKQYKNFPFFVSFSLSSKTYAFKMEMRVKARYAFSTENLGFSFSFVI